jgi:transposase InsO family protein
MRTVRDQLSVIGGVLMYGHRVIVPLQLRRHVLRSLHSAHQGVSSMMGRVMQSVWWPGIQEDVHNLRTGCQQCDTNMPSQQVSPPEPVPAPDYPFQQVCSDYLQLGGYTYCIIVDRFSGWASVFQTKSNSTAELCVKLREYFLTFGAPEQLSTDGGSQYTSRELRDFLRVWGVSQRVSSAYTPHGNSRAEIGVKSVKRLLRNNVGHGGSLDVDKFAQALMQHRNTPDRDICKSPAEIVFGRQIRHSKRDKYICTREGKGRGGPAPN